MITIQPYRSMVKIDGITFVPVVSARPVCHYCAFQPGHNGAWDIPEATRSEACNSAPCRDWQTPDSVHLFYRHKQ
jgi:hypothetical protein